MLAGFEDGDRHSFEAAHGHEAGGAGQHAVHEVLAPDGAEPDDAVGDVQAVGEQAQRDGLVSVADDDEADVLVGLVDDAGESRQEGVVALVGVEALDRDDVGVGCPGPGRGCRGGAGFGGVGQRADLGGRVSAYDLSSPAAYG